MKIGLDIDGVLCNFAQGIINKADQMSLGHKFPQNWLLVRKWCIAQDRADYLNVWNEVKDDRSFWLHLNPIPHSSWLRFEPDCYISNRPHPDITLLWLWRNKYPQAPVFHVKDPLDKVQVAQERELDLFIDDYHPTIAAMRKAGVPALLFKAPYQQGEEFEELPTISDLKEVPQWTRHNQRIAQTV